MFRRLCDYEWTKSGALPAEDRIVHNGFVVLYYFQSLKKHGKDYLWELCVKYCERARNIAWLSMNALPINANPVVGGICRPLNTQLPMKTIELATVHATSRKQQQRGRGVLAIIRPAGSQASGHTHSWTGY